MNCRQMNWVAVSLSAFMLTMGCNRSAPQTTNDDEVQGTAPQAAEARNEQDESAEAVEPAEFEVSAERVAGPFEHPWAVAFLPDNQMLVTERPGRLQLVVDGEAQEVSGLPEISTQGQGGLLDVVIHPNYVENRWIYMTFSKPGEGGNTATALMRGRLNGAALQDVEEIFVQNRYSGAGRHYGSRLAWTGAGLLLMSIGDRGAEPPRAQDTADHAGSLLRLNDDGSAAEGNPFVGSDEGLDEIFAWGLRNIQGLTVDIENERIWASDHGPRGGDEINLVEGGENYGWPRQTHGRDYRTGGPFPGSEGEVVEGMVNPVHVFDPTHPPSGLALVDSERYPGWEGNLLSGGLASQVIYRLTLDGTQVVGEEKLLEEELGRIRDVRQGPDGFVYVLIDASEGNLYRLEVSAER
ncbi:MAG: PQQ-dependent sugar dehydrogenase [Bradymonadaceae bacterium]